MTLPRRAGIPLAAAAALFLTCSAHAREDDVDFALRLADRGYDYLAQREVDRMLQGGSVSPDKKENSEYTRCQLLRRTALLAAANEKSDPSEVRAKFNAASKAFEAFLKNFPNSRLKADAEFTMSELMTKFAYYLTKNKDKFPAVEQEGVVKEANKTFEDAIRYLQTIKQREDDRAKAALQKKNPDEPELDEEELYRDRNVAWYYLCMAMHDRAMLLPAGDALRTQQLGQAIDQTKELLEQTDGGIFGYYAGLLLGKACWHRAEMKKGWAAGDIKQANEWFCVPIDAVDTYTNVEQDWPALVDLILEAAVQYGQMCNQVGTVEKENYPRFFIEKANELEEKVPNSVRGKQWGLTMLIEKARAMSSMGDHEGAISQLNKIINLASQADSSWGKAVEQAAKRGLNEVLGAIPPDAPVQLAPDILFKAGEGSLRDGSLGRAIRAFQKVLVAIENEADLQRKKVLSDEFEVKCWARLNECYTKMERYLEAYLAADLPVQKYLASGKKGDFDAVGWLAFGRIVALNEFTKRAPKEVQPKYSDLLRGAKELLTREFAGHDSTSSTAYQVAVSRLDNAATLLSNGETQRSMELFQQAIDDFTKVDAKDNNYPMAQARIGQARVQMGKAEEGLKWLQGFVKANLAEWTNPNTPAPQKRPWGWAAFWMAMAYDDLKQPAKVVELLEDYERKFAGATLEPTYPRVRYTRIAALVLAGRGADAEKEVQGLLKDSPDSPYSPMAALVVANDLKARADKAHKEGNRKLEQDLRTRSADLYDFWVRRSGNAGSDDLKFVGSLFADIGNGERAAELWGKALEGYLKEKKTKEAETITIYLAGLLVGQGKYAEALPKFEDLFIKTPGDVAPLREVFEWLKRKPSNVAQAVHDKMIKDTLAKIAEELDRDPAGAAGVGEAKKAAATGETETLVRAYADNPEQRRALARAAALTMLGTDAAMPAERKNAVFALVKRTPDLMANLARCYEELATASAENPIRAVNLYSTLIDAAVDPEGETPQPGQRYSERWFEWKRRWINVYLTTGTAYKSEVWLKIVCDLVKSMETKEELARASKERLDMSKEFEALRDKADSVLRGLGKEGCK